METPPTPPEAPPQERRDTEPTFTRSLLSNSGMVAWYRSLVERPRLRFLRRRAGRRWLAVAHLLSLLAVAGWASVVPSWPWAGLAYPGVMVVFFLLTGLLHAVTFGMMALRWRDLDERQRLVQGWAYRRAHRVSAGVFVAALVGVLAVFGLQETVVIERSTTLFVVAAFLIAVAWLPAHVLAWSRHVDDLDA